MKTSKILILSLLAGSALAFTACSDDEPNKSISVITPGNTEGILTAGCWLILIYRTTSTSNTVTRISRAISTTILFLPNMNRQ